MQGTVGEPGSRDPDTPSTWSCVAYDASGASANQTYSSSGDLLPVRAARRLALAVCTVSLPVHMRAASYCIYFLPDKPSVHMPHADHKQLGKVLSSVLQQ